MAKEFGNDEPAEKLREEIARSRERLTRDLRGLRYELDFPRKIRRSFQTQTVLWLAAAAAAGLLFTVLPGRKKKFMSMQKARGNRPEDFSKLGSCLAF